MSPKSETKPKATKPAEQKVPKMKYWEVTFNHKQNTNETTDVQLSVNGEQLVIKRGVKVIIPDSYKEVADHGTYQTFEQKPGVDRKITGTVQVYPYQMHKEATEAEFRKQLQAGNKMARDAAKMKAEQG